MSRQLSEIEHLLRQLVVEHQKLLKHAEAHHDAMKRMDLTAMEEAAKLQEAARLRIASMEARRRVAVQQLAKVARIQGQPTVARLAEAFPDRAPVLLKLRDELKEAVGQISQRSHVGSRLAGALLGHLNTAVRVLAGAVERTGVYTKTGAPRVSSRIGIMNAVG